MDAQHISLFRMKNRIGPTVLCLILSLILSPLILFTLCLPQALGVVPALFAAMLGYIGPVCAFGCAAIIAAVSGFLFGIWGAAAAVFFLFPVMIMAAVHAERKSPFWISAVASGTTSFISMSLIIALLGAAAGSDVVTAMMGIIRSTFSAGDTVSDSVLMMLVQTGLLSLDSGIPQISQITGLLTEAARETLVAQMITVLDATLRLELPMQMATGAICAGIFGQALLNKGLRKRGMDVPYAPLRMWRVPKGWGRVLGVTLLALYLLSMLLPAVASSMFYVFAGAIELVFALQGIAALSHILHKNGAKRIWHYVLFAAGFLPFRSIASMLGVMDQAIDFTHRREAFADADNPYDPRGGADR